VIEPMSVEAGEPMDVTTASFPVSDGYLLQFDTTISQFNVITLPMVTGKFRRPESVVATGSDIWYTDPGTDRIGRLAYTDTNNYTFSEIELPAGSAPFDMVADGGYLWFTAKNGDWIGRLEISTTAVVSFPLTAGSAPWRMAVGSDGSVWFTERETNKLGRLVVTDTNDFLLTEYDIPDSNSKPEGIAIQNKVGSDLVWFGETAPENNTKVVRFNYDKLPPDDFVSTGVLGGAGYPGNMAIDSGRFWTTELLGNHLSLIDIATNSSAAQYLIPTENSQPYDLVTTNSGNNVWFTERLGHRLGKLYNDLTGFHFIEYTLPMNISDVWLQGITIDSQGKLWLTGFEPNSIYLPLVIK